MKNLIKLLPVCAGMLALASCSENDLVGKDANVDLSGKVVLKVTDGDNLSMRSYKDGSFNTVWGEGDVLRVYDSKMQAYDKFEYAADEEGEYLFTKESDYVKNMSDYKFALYGVKEDNVSYGGWKDGNNIALVKVDASYNYERTTITKTTTEGDEATEETVAVYKSILPMFGNVSVSGDELGVSMYSLVGSISVTLKNAKQLNPTAVRVRSVVRKANFGDIELKAHDLSTSYESYLTTPTVKANANIMLNGWFEAVLDENIDQNPAKGGLQPIVNEPISNSPTNVITADLTGGLDDLEDDDMCMVFFPIVPSEDYDMLLFEYALKGEDGKEEWHYIKHLAGENAKVYRNTRKNTTIGNIEGVSNVTVPGKGAEASDNGDKTGLADILELYKDATYDVQVDVNKPEAGKSATAIVVGNSSSKEANYVLEVPTLASNITLNIYGNITGNNNTLKIQGNENGKGTLTINYLGTAAVQPKIEINNGKIVLANGSFGYGEVTANKAQDLTLNGAFSKAVTIGNVVNLTLGGTFEKNVVSSENTTVTGDININGQFKEKIALNTATEEGINLVPVTEDDTQTPIVLTKTAEKNKIEVTNGKFKKFELTATNDTVVVGGTVKFETSQDVLTAVPTTTDITIGAKTITLDLNLGTTATDSLAKNVALTAETINLEKALRLRGNTTWTTTGAINVNNTVVAKSANSNVTWNHTGDMTINNSITNIDVVAGGNKNAVKLTKGTVTKLTLNNGITSATVDASAAAATITTLNVNTRLTSGLTLTGAAKGVGGEAKVTTLNGYTSEVSTSKTTVKSTGKASIGTVKEADAFTFTSTISSADDAVNTSGNTRNIYTAAQFVGLTNATASTANITINLNTNITTMSGVAWTGIKLFESDATNATRTFNGNNHTITSVKSATAATNDANLGLFTKIATSKAVTIKDLTLKSWNMTATAADNIGVIAGSNAANLTLENVVVSSATVYGNSAVGGLIGNNSGNVTVKGTSSVQVSTARADYHVGGLVGYTTGNVTVGDEETAVPVAVTTFNSKTAAAKYNPAHTPNEDTTQAGTFGMLIGNVNAATAEVKAYVGEITNNLTSKKEALKFSNAKENLMGLLEVVFTGSTNNEIGYSPNVATGKVIINGTEFKATTGENGATANNTVNYFVAATE